MCLKSTKINIRGRGWRHFKKTIKVSLTLIIFYKIFPGKSAFCASENSYRKVCQYWSLFMLMQCLCESAIVWSRHCIASGRRMGLMDWRKLLLLLFWSSRSRGSLVDEQCDQICRNFATLGKLSKTYLLRAYFVYLSSRLDTYQVG